MGQVIYMSCGFQGGGSLYLHFARKGGGHTKIG